MRDASNRPTSMTSPAESSLRAAARAVADPGHRIDAASLVVTLPRLDGAARPLLYTAERLANEYGLEVSVRLGGGHADVHFRLLDTEDR